MYKFPTSQQARLNSTTVIEFYFGADLISVQAFFYLN